MTAAALPRPRETIDTAAGLLLVILCASWGLQQVAVKVAVAGIPPVLQSGGRSLLATALLLLWCWARGIPLWQRDGTLTPGLIAGLLFGFEFVMIYWGMTFTNASRGVLFTYTAPFWVAIGAHFFLTGDRLSRVKIIGLAAAFAGIAVAFAEGFNLPSGREIIGDSMCLLAALGWAATTIVIKGSKMAGISAEKTLFYQLAVSGIVLTPLSPVFAERMGELTPAVLLAFAYSTVVVAFVSFVAWFWFVRHYPASRLSAFTFLTPVCGVLFGHLILDEPIGAPLIASAALIAIGIYLVNRPAALPAPAASSTGRSD